MKKNPWVQRYPLLTMASVNVLLLTALSGCFSSSDNAVTPIDPGIDLKLSENGVPYTNDFDLAIYVKGDKKATLVKDAKLLIEYRAPGATETTTWESEPHVFSVNDVMGGVDGTTFADTPEIICGLPESKDTTCPTTAAQPKEDKSGVMLYPVDSQFGFYVQDFTGAADKKRDGDYGEGWVGNHPDGGVMVSNADTVSFKTGQNKGTWCAGLGGNAVKCSTEHYVVMESIQTCHETIPTNQAATQRDLLDPADPEGTTIVGSCGDKPLDNDLFVLVNNEPTTQLTSVTPGVDMEPNESTVRDEIALGTSYSITLKDDGKPLYRWGNMMKRPNDVRLYAKIGLPDEWKALAAAGDSLEGYEIVRAELVINHWITNNPNDQVRPEDLENEGAIGRLPGFTDSNGMWLSDKECYAGNGEQIPQGAVLKNGNEALVQADGFSEDLREGFTHYWYTTTDRDPFEWSYENGSSALPTDTLGGVVSGPRWRLKPNKFGQDIPGLEIPTTNCIAPPFTSANLKYEVGTETQTVLNLLDYDEGEFSESPLGSSVFWTAVEGGDES